ncbi:MAG: hypothetical protein KJ072_20920 [Verrucomicrobia bacterium]|nr:hypothetical protein [Verrucomicrobiota bacterium]
MNPTRSRWILALAGTAVLVVLILLTVANHSDQDKPQLRLRELHSSEGKQWVLFTVVAPSNSPVTVQYERLLGMYGWQTLETFEESNTRLPIRLLSGRSQEVQVQAPVSGVWRVRFFFHAPRKGVLLWIDRLTYGWQQRKMDFLSVTPWWQEWILESEPFTNAVPGHP